MASYPPSNFKQALEFVLRYEGGFSDHPKDPGGATNKGITQATYNKYLINLGQPIKSVRLITDQEVEDIYYTLYWLKANCDLLPNRLACLVFDWAVNGGVKRAIEFLQSTISQFKQVNIDGMFGSQTREILNQLIEQNLEDKLVSFYLQKRLDYYNKLGQKMQSFLNGWKNRLMGISIFLFKI